jgi:hypothetical protein
MAASALKNSGLTTYTLTFQVPTATLRTNSRGDKVPVTEATPVEVFLEVTRSPVLRALLGADEKSVAFEGVCVDPKTLPAGILDGATATMTMGAQTGVFRLTIDAPSLVAEIDNVMGQPIIGVWRAQ